MRFSLGLILACLASATPAALHATPITYAISESVGSSSIQGNVMTDGKLGALAGSDILAFSFTNAAGTYTYSSAAPMGSNGLVFVVGNDLIASAQGLSFNFSASDMGGFAFTDSNASNLLCFTSSSNQCLPNSTGSILISSGGIVMASGVLTGTQSIGNAVASAAVTPEPESLALVGTGLFGLLGLWRRRIA